MLEHRDDLAACEALADLRAATEEWDASGRTALIERFCDRAAAGAPLPAAFIFALTDVLGGARD